MISTHVANSPCYRIFVIVSLLIVSLAVPHCDRELDCRASQQRPKAPSATQNASRKSSGGLNAPFCF